MARTSIDTGAFSASIGRAALIRIAVSARAYRAIKVTLPVGSVVYPPQRNDRGQYLLWLTGVEANRLAALRRRGESYSDAVIRLANHAQD